MPFLRLTRDRRGFENTFLLHADRPGDRPRLLYWFRTAPGIVLGRSPLDEDAIRTIEDNHPDIEFDWPAILALSEVMTPEEEEPVQRPPKQSQKKSASAGGQQPSHLRRDDRSEDAIRPVAVDEADVSTDSASTAAEAGNTPEPRETVAPPQGNPLLEELVGREIATRLRARYSEIMTRIDERGGDLSMRDAWLERAERLNPDLWVTPEVILEAVRNADALFDALRSELQSSRE